MLEDWKQYKLSVPTYGAIIISDETPKHVLLVQSYFAKSSWGFPKGKVNEHEDTVHCAIREVYEETGFDITSRINPNDYIEMVINFQYTRLYLVQGVRMDTKFAPRTRKEIKSCEWFPVDQLPSNKYQMETKTNLGIGPNSFFMILPFIKRLKRWLNEQQTQRDKNAAVKANGTPANGGPQKKPNRMNISNFHYETNGNSATNTPKESNSTGNTFFADNQKASRPEPNGVNQLNGRRSRHKSVGEMADATGGFKLANFDIPLQQMSAIPPLQQSTPKEPRRKLIFDNNNDKIDKIFERPRPLKPFGKLAQDRVKIWTNFRFDKQKIFAAMGM